MPRQTKSNACMDGNHDDCGLVAPDGQPCACDCHQAGSDLALMLEERKSERRAEALEAPGVSQCNWEDDHQPYWRN